MNSIAEALKNRIIFCDGGMGTLLQQRGLKGGEQPERWNIDKPEIIVDIHTAYLNAGADIITTNTFGANSIKFGDQGKNSAENVIAAGVANARKAVDAYGAEGKFVALDIGPTGKLLKPLGDLDFEDAVNVFAHAVRCGVKSGADLVLIETMSDSYEARAAIIAAKENCSLPVIVSFVFDENGKLLTGGSPETAVIMAESLGVDAVGMNCGKGPHLMKKLLPRLLKTASVPVLVNPNAGMPRAENGKTVFDISPDEFASVMREIAEMGAGIVGGCCGTTPEYIRKTSELCAGIKWKTPDNQPRTLVSGNTNVVEIGDRPVIIGERINPTGKPKFKKALADNDIEYIFNEAIRQKEGGADILDVNVGLPEIDEKKILPEVVSRLQAVVDLPLQIDTADPAAMEKALRVYNGRAIINSVNGKRESMDAIFPIAKKYGGVTVALLLDENGIPDTVQGRMDIALKICSEAEKYGIDRHDIIFDALTLTVSSDETAPATTLETVRRIRTELGCGTVLGVSNISFGLPQREYINSTFFALALQSGLTAAIINPLSAAMISTYRSFLALNQMDSACRSYVEYASQLKTVIQQSEVKTSNEERAGDSLVDAIVHGLKDGAVSAAEELLKNNAPMDIVNNSIIPSLDRVGKDFEKGTVFLPQLLMSAEAAKAAFEVIKNAIAASGNKNEKIGRIILATVEGDIHDIGKNIVKVLLESYNFDVIDLGRDVPAQVIADKVKELNVPVVGLSALMTTTVPSMEATIKLLRKTSPECKVCVGGAVLTQEYADMIDADKYCPDAMSTVTFAQQIYNV
ncbi:MAG: homocysteine S-methyltransferase family protein [Clostridiales bacterium]|nr:homocysteine S-methyltransferase family protein [Clostridiales bacterium]